MRVSSLKSIKANYKVLMTFFEEYSSTDYSSTAKAKAFLGKMQSFDFLFFLNFVIELLGPIEILNKDLQSPRLSVVDSYKKINIVINLLKAKRETMFDSVWTNSKNEKKDLDVNDPLLSRKRKVPSKLGGNDTESTLTTAEEFFMNIFEKCFDSVLESFAVRFNKANQKIHKSLEKLLLNQEDSAERLIIEDLYKDDIDFCSFNLHRQMFYEFVKIRKAEHPTCLEDVVDFLQKNSETAGLCPVFTKFVTLLMTIPGSSCTNERSFSLMKRLKSYLRSTMNQDRLNYIAILSTYKEMARDLNMDIIIDEFISLNSLRQTTFSMS